MKAPRPAFPSQYSLGLTKLEWFAGMAMQGELARQGNDLEWTQADELAKWSFKIAEAMIDESDKYASYR